MTDDEYIQGLIQRGEPIPPGSYTLTRTIELEEGQQVIGAPAP